MTRALIFACALVGASAGLADEEADPYWTVQVDPLTTALGFVHVQVEQRVGHHVSVYLGPHLRLFSPPFGAYEPYLGFGIEAGLRVFPWGRAPTGWWIGARGVAAHIVATDGSARPAVGGYLSALAGYTWVFNEHFLLSGGAGVQTIRYRVGDYGPEGIFPALHTALGFAF